MVRNTKKTGSSKSIDPETLKEIIDKLKATVLDRSKNKCWVSRLKPNGRGHVQIKHKGVKYLGHRIMACARTKPYKYVEYSADTKLEASHLCGTPSCIDKRHLFFENNLVNQTRDCCRMFGKKKGYWCPHKPHCIGCKPIKKTK